MSIEAIKVDIIIPVYNKEKYIKKCVDSILNQTHKNFNLILVDDGSTDNSGKICEEYQKIDRRIKYVYQSNSGQTSARKRGLEYTETEYVLFIDADDWVDCDYLEILISELSKHHFQCDLVTAGITIEENDDCIAALSSVEKGIYKGKEIKDIIQRFLFDEIGQREGIVHSMCGKIFKKDKINIVLKEMNEIITYGEDVITVFSYLLKAEFVIVSDYVGYHYIQIEDSTVHTFTENDTWKLMILKDEYVKLMTKVGIYEEMKCGLANWIYRNYLESVGRSMGLKYGTYFIIPKFLYQDEVNIVIYGAGKKGKQFQRKVSKMKNVKCVGWIDRNYSKIPSQYGVDSIDKLMEWEYDYILIAIENEEIVHSVVENLLCMDIPYKKIWGLQKERYFYLDN